MSESFSSEPEAKKGGAADAERTGEFEMVQEAPMFDWDGKKGCTCCGCLSYVLQVIAVAAGCGSFLFGFNLSLLNTSVNTIARDFKWCDYEGITDCSAATNYTAFVQTGVFIGAAIGSMTAGNFLFLGRRMCLLLSMSIFAFGIITSCVASAFPTLVWARLVVGYAVGVVSFICPMYIAEMSPADRRGTYGVLHQLAITVGIFVGVLIGLPFGSPGEDLTDEELREWELSTFDKIWWRVMLGLGIIPTVMSSYLLFKTYKFETPHYYVENRRMKDAEVLMKLLYNKDDVMTELMEIEKGYQDAKAAKDAGLSCGSAMGDSEYRWVIIVGCTLSAFQQLSGINVFITGSNELFADAGLDGTMVTVMSTILTLVNVLMTFPSLYLIEAMGRKSLMLMGTIGQLIGVLPGAIMMWIMDDDHTPTQWVSIVGAIVFIVFFAVAYGPVLWVFLFEIYPAEIKGVAAGTATGFNWIFSIVMVFSASYLSLKISYTIFAALNAIAVVCVITMMKETKGRSMDDSPYITKGRH
eukprot:Polyplicarium_translucidae@DN2084_c0_g1_i1.p1